MEGVVSPVLQDYVVAPEAVSVVVPPWQNGVRPLMATVGNSLMTSVLLVLLEQLFASVTVTVYTPSVKTVMRSLVELVDQW